LVPIHDKAPTVIVPTVAFVANENLMKLFQKFFHISMLCALVIFVYGRIFHQDINVQPDSSRYINMGLAVADFILGPIHQDGSETPPLLGYGDGGPFAAAEIGLAVTLSTETRNSLECLKESKSLINACHLDIDALLFVYGTELLIFHMAVGLIAYLIFGNTTKAWLAVAFSLAFKETKIYSASILTEPSSMMAGGLFLLLWVYCWKHPDKIKYWFWCGLALGLLILSKPSWQALLPAFIVLFVLYATVTHHVEMAQIRPLGMLVGGAILLMAPLIIRNGFQINVWSLNNPNYMSAPLAHRFGYNFMSWTEWTAGWIYYLPDFGDKLAKSLFGEDLISKLGWGEDSYYVYGRDVLHKLAVTNAPDGHVAGYLVREYFFNDLPKSIAVTALLTWRGIFVGGLMGLVALVLSAPVFYFQPAQARKMILLLVLPVMIMAAVQAVVSINLLRYNLLLVAPYALILAQTLYVLGAVIGRHLPPALRIKAESFLR